MITYDISDVVSVSTQLQFYVEALTNTPALILQNHVVYKPTGGDFGDRYPDSGWQLDSDVFIPAIPEFSDFALPVGLFSILIIVLTLYIRKNKNK